MKAPLPDNEARRLEVLREYNVLDSMPEQAFDDLTLLAAQICQTPIALISLVDENRQWFKSRVGLSAAETSRDAAFCAHAILNADQVLEVSDAQLDPRFADNPLVTSDPHIRFYAGAPLVAQDGVAMGTLCAIDRVPRKLNAEQKTALQALSRTVVARLELRRAAQQQEQEQKQKTLDSSRSDKKMWALENATLLAFTGAVLALLIVGAISIRSLLLLGQQVDWVQHTQQIVTQADRMLANVVEVQNGPRGYLITGEDSYLATYNVARLALPQDVQNLRRLTMDSPVQQQRLDVIEPLVEKRLDISRNLVELRQTQGFKIAQAAMMVGQGQAVTEQLRLLQNEVVADEQRRLTERNHEKNDRIRFTLVSIGSLGALSVIILGLAGIRIRREIVARSETQARVEMLNADLKSRATELAAARHRAETSDRLKSAILEHAGHAIISTTPDGIITSFNQTAERMLGYAASEVLGLQTPTIIHDPGEVEARAREFSAELGETIEPGFEVFVAKARRNLPNEYEWTYIRKDGTRFPVLLSVTALRDASGEITGFLGMAVDITQRKQAEKERDRMFNYALDVYGIANFNGYFIQVNPAWERTLGWTAAELLAKPYLEFIHPDDRDATTNAAGELVDGKVIYSFDNRYLCKDGTYKWFSWVAYPLAEEGLIFAVARDTTERKRAEAELRDNELQLHLALEELRRREEVILQQAMHDELTGLPNRRLFYDRLTMAISEARRHGLKVAVAFIDLDYFKEINDKLGHEAGDKFLVAIAHKIKAVPREEDTCARLGGDEFALILSNVEGKNQVGLVAQRILDSLNHEVIIDGTHLHASASIGVAIFPEDAEDAPSLLKRADMAMYRSKEEGRNTYRFWDKEMGSTQNTAQATGFPGQP